MASAIGYANNGVKALEMVRRIQPDVVMTEYQYAIYGRNGAGGHIKADYPGTKLLLTGFDEFEYAKEAEYILEVRVLLFYGSN